MLSLNSISAWIEVNGKELEQYGVEEDPDHNKVTCWIPTQADQNFSVVFRDNAAHRDHALCSSLYLDGTSVGGKILHPPTQFGHHANFATTRAAVQNDQALSATSSRAFIFSKLELTDEDEYLNRTSAHLGEIQIRIYRAQVLATRLFQGGSSATGHTKVHERSKKAVTHCVSYGKEVQTPPQYSSSVRYLDGTTPLVTFIFRYRDFGLLQANGIIPKPPPTESKAIVSEEVEIVENATQSRKRSAVPTKRSNSGYQSEAKPAKRIKRENKFIPTGEVIDLT